MGALAEEALNDAELLLCRAAKEPRDGGLTYAEGKLGLGRNLCKTAVGAEPGRAS
jgi:hypothetical protein